ncbi:MAG: hypothetical protein IPL21_06340 [Saprospirales bacterium]|nr:hypothetical protein [Saprospirales bacterium]
MKTIKIITLIAIVILAISCKKENVNNNTVDNPNITHRILNKEIIAKADLTEFSLIDIDNNGVDDFAVELYLQNFRKMCVCLEYLVATQVWQQQQAAKIRILFKIWQQNQS